MRIFKIFSNNFGNNKLDLLSQIFLLQFSMILYLRTSSGKMNFSIRNKTFWSKETNPLQTEFMGRSFRHLINANKRNEQKQQQQQQEEQDKFSMQKSLNFIYYKNGKFLLKNSLDAETSVQSYSLIINSCVNEKISFIFHGWTESCHTEWVPQLNERLTFYRGGCIICVDYSSWSKQSYIKLLQKFDAISDVLYAEILKLIDFGLNPNKIFMFGFSYGGQVASKIGRQLKPQYNIKKIDICDMAGPGFDFFTYFNHSEAAENVQCYYTSLDKGSHYHSCHQNIRLGHCGYTQPAILSQPYFSSHGLCVRMYIYAFDYPFYAIQKASRWCERDKTINNLPAGFTVGYNEDAYKNMTGDIFVPTTLNYPYNLSRKEIILYEKYLEAA